MGRGHLLALIAGVVVIAAAVASGVTYGLVGHDSAAHGHALPPIVLTGLLKDPSGKPVSHEWVQLTATDTSNARIGVPIPVHQLAGAYSDAAGRFTIRQTGSVPILRRMAAENGNWVNFEVDFSGSGQVMPWAVPRKLSHGAWLAEDNPNLAAALKTERITVRPFPGLVRVSSCATETMPECSADATEAEEEAVGLALRRLPNVERVLFVSKKHALALMKQGGSGIVNGVDQWLVTTESVSAQPTVGKAICAAHYRGVEPCGSAAGVGAVQWDTVSR